MEMWFSEFHTPDVKHSIRVNRQLYSKQSDYQRIDIFETPEFGRVLTLDGNVMLTERDEFIYDEMITHVPMSVHRSAKDILVIGARFPLDVDMDNVILVDCMESDNSNSIQFDHAFAAETACNYLTSQGRRQIALIHPHGSGFADQVLLGYKHALEKNFLPFNRNLVFMDETSSSVALQELLNNASTLNFNALLVADEQEAQRVIPQLQAFNKSVPEDIMVFSLAGSLHLPGIPVIPAIEYSMDAMAARIVSWLTEKTQMLGSYVLRGDLIIPDVRKR